MYCPEKWEKNDNLSTYDIIMGRCMILGHQNIHKINRDYRSRPPRTTWKYIFKNKIMAFADRYSQTTATENLLIVRRKVF